MARRLSTQCWPLLWLFAVSALAHAEGQKEGRWAAHRDEEGVRLERRTDGSPGPAFRATAEVNAGIFEVMAVLSDAARRTEWMPRCVESRALESTPMGRVLYTRTAGAWPVSDRDAVVRSQVKISPAGDQAEIRMESIEWPAFPPVDGVVRMSELSGLHLLTSLGEERTRVMHQVVANMGGNVPDFVLEFVREQMLLDSLVALRDQIETTRGLYSAEIARMREDLTGTQASP